MPLANKPLPMPPANKTGWPWEGDSVTPNFDPSFTGWPKISIITPSYNQGRFLERTLRSVLLQGYPNLEYIVMDGGSRDESVQIIEKYADHIDYWVSEKDRGQAHALNKGLERCTGDVIAFVNSDDYYLPDTLRRVGRLFIEHPQVAWLSGVCRYYDEKVGFVEGDKQYIYQMPPLPQDRSEWVDNWPTNQPASFWRSSCFAGAGNFREDLDLVFDTEFILRVLFTSGPPLIVDEIFAVYSLHDSSKTISQRGKYADEADRFRPEFYKYLDQQESQRLFWRRTLRGYRSRVNAEKRLKAYAFVLGEMAAHPVWFARGMWARWQGAPQ